MNEIYQKNIHFLYEANIENYDQLINSDVYTDYGIYKWLLNHTLKEQTDFNGIEIYLDDLCNIHFSW